MARELRGAASLANAVCHEHLRKGKEGVRTDGSLLPSGADDGTCVLAARLAGQPRNRSSSSPRQRMLSDVPDGGSGPKETHSGGGFSRGVRAATARWTSRAWKALGDARGRAAGSRRSATYTTRRAPAVADVVVVPPARREGVSRKSTARVSPPATAAASTASASRLAEQRPSVGEVALSHLVAVGVSSSPANIGSSFRGRAAAAAPPSRRLYLA